MFRCGCCRTRRKTWEGMQAHLKKWGHAVCRCGGYHYAHRPGSKFCDLNPMCEVWRHLRAGDCGDDELAELEVEIAATKPGKPFKMWRD